MRNKNVIINFDLFCEWTKSPPTYRVYVNHEMVTERTYLWGDTEYLTERVTVSAPDGSYVIRVDNLGDPECVFKIRNLAVEAGDARVVDSKTFEITP
jgi:hypothetical protein